MPFRWTINHEDQLVQVVAEGAFGVADFLQFFAALSDEEAIPYRKLFDMRAGAPTFSESDSLAYAGAVAGYASQRPVGPVAIVAPLQPDEAATALLSRLMVTPRRVSVFASPGPALTWLLRQPVPTSIDPDEGHRRRKKHR